MRIHKKKQDYRFTKQNFTPLFETTLLEIIVMVVETLKEIETLSIHLLIAIKGIGFVIKLSVNMKQETEKDKI